MPTDITIKTITRAKADARTTRINITDARGRGLVLRGGPEGLTWGHRVQLNGSQHRLVLGTVDRWTVAEARAIADAASDYAKSHKTPPDEDWLQKHLIGTGKIEAPPAQEVVVNLFPTFAEGRRDFLENASGRLKASSVNSYKDFLAHPLVSALDDRPLPSITLDAVREIVIAIHAGGHERTAEAVSASIRPMFRFLGEAGRRTRYGVEPGIMAELRAPARTYADDDDDDNDDPWSAGYVPEISELGRIIAVARTGIISPVPAAHAIELLCWTVQRRTTVAQARIRDFVHLGNGTGLWNVPAGSRKSVGKGKRPKPHTIPLPAPAWQCVLRAYEAAMKMDKETKYLFPATRVRRAGGVKKHMHASTLGHRFTDIPGCAAAPHDVRRSMGTYGEQMLGFSRVDTGTIMDHTESRKISERITSRTAGTGTDDVTGLHYSLHDGSHHTWPVMRVWCDAIDKAVQEATRTLESTGELARTYGDKNYRSNAGAGLIAVGVLSTAERDAKKALVKRRTVRMLGDRSPDDEE